MRRLALAAALLLAAAGSSAQTVYVTDILRLGIHQAQDTSDPAFDSLVSGTALEILERVPNYARVETPDGRTGWVKSAYLVSEKPAQLRVAELEARVAELENELRNAQEARIHAEQQMTEIEERHAASVSSAAAIEDTLARLKTRNDAYERRLDTYRGALPLSWVAAALAVCLIGGIVGGTWWLDARIRRRHGGFRVY
jgi:SH3 domain protein